VCELLPVRVCRSIGSGVTLSRFGDAELGVRHYDDIHDDSFLGHLFSVEAMVYWMTLTLTGLLHLPLLVFGSW